MWVTSLVTCKFWSNLVFLTCALRLVSDCSGCTLLNFGQRFQSAEYVVFGKVTAFQNQKYRFESHCVFKGNLTTDTIKLKYESKPSCGPVSPLLSDFYLFFLSVDADDTNVLNVNDYEHRDTALEKVDNYCGEQEGNCVYLNSSVCQQQGPETIMYDFVYNVNGSTSGSGSGSGTFIATGTGTGTVSGNETGTGTGTGADNDTDSDADVTDVDTGNKTNTETKPNPGRGTDSDRNSAHGNTLLYTLHMVCVVAGLVMTLHT